jgi:prepilin-type N-terminal cleavage/methylation domain-containing protein
MSAEDSGFTLIRNSTACAAQGGAADRADQLGALAAGSQGTCSARLRLRLALRGAELPPEPTPRTSSRTNLVWRGRRRRERAPVGCPRRQAPGPDRLAIGGSGFTLIEVVISLAIVGALLVITYGGLRVGLSAWRQGEERSEAHQHVRGISTLLAGSVAAAYPYRTRAAEDAQSVIQFDGTTDHLSFVTLTAPFPLDPSIAFTAVRVGLDAGDEPGLTIRQWALPNRDIFSNAPPMFRDPTISKLHFRYRHPGGEWSPRWDGATERSLPAAVQIAVETSLHGRAEALPPLTVTLRTLRP